jgi:hypothetical protein
MILYDSSHFAKMLRKFSQKSKNIIYMEACQRQQNKIRIVKIFLNRNNSLRIRMFIPEPPDPNFSIPDPGSRVKKIPDLGSGSAAKKLNIFDPKNRYVHPGPDPGSGS